MNNITNKQLNALDNAIFMLEEQLEEISASTPSLADAITDDEWDLMDVLNDTIKGLKELDKVLKGRHA